MGYFVCHMRSERVHTVMVPDTPQREKGLNDGERRGCEMPCMRERERVVDAEE